MKCILVVMLICCAVNVWAQQSSRTFDNIDVDNVLSNDRVRENYVKCLIGSGPCTAEGRELKKVLPEAIKSNCGRCTPKQRTNLVKAVNFFETRHNADWKKLATRYDPKGVYLANFKKSGRV